MSLVGRLAALAGALLFAGAAIAAESRSSADADLRATVAARARRADADARWAEESQTLQAVLAAQRQTADGLRAEAADLERRCSELRVAAAAPESPAAVDVMLAAGSRRLAARLRERVDAVMPGLIVWSEAADGEDPFTALVATVQRVEHAVAEVAVLTLEGEIGNGRLVVRALRVGAACAWWVSLDGTRAGTVKRQGGRTVLAEDPAPATRQAIVRAMELVGGRGASGIIVLPLAEPAP